jgi:putative transposase
MEILTLFACCAPFASSVSLRQLSIIAQAILTMSGRVTMLGISRWTSEGGSYRTIQRFFATVLPWQEMKVKFFETHLFNPQDEHILAGDETVIGKAGTETFGVSRFFSGLRGKVIRGLGFFVFSIVNTVERKAYPVMCEQRITEQVSEKPTRAKKKKRKGKRGRTKGSRNRDKREFKPSSELKQLNEMLQILLKSLRRFVKIKYLTLDGHFGHSQAVLMAQQNELELISKLRKDAVLYEKYEGQYGGKGPKRKYGKRLKYDLLPVRYLQQVEKTETGFINYYAGEFWHKEFAELIKVVIIVKIDVQKQKIGHAILFSSDINLDWEKLIDYYSLRFQIEFNFRDAKQHFGLEDFMNTTQVGVINAANLAFLMVLLSAKLLKNSKEKLVGINDLKTHYRGAKYAVWIIKKVLPNPEPILIKQIIEEVSRLGSIHQAKTATSSA